MHRVYIKGVRSLEDKFDKDKADWIPQKVATIRFDETPLTEAAAYDKTYGYIITEAEYQQLSGGREGWIMPEHVRQAFITAINVMKDLLEGGQNESGS